MNRRDFVTASTMLIGAGWVGVGNATATVTGEPVSADAKAVKQLIADYYETFFRTRDKKKYRSLLTEDYLLLENGKIMDAAADMASMPAPESDYKRSDVFDFRLVNVYAETAYIVYFLRSVITFKKRGPYHREYLESAVLRRSGSAWRVALLHSTKIVKPAT